MFAAEFGWRPEPHSIDEVELWSKRLREVFEIDARLNREAGIRQQAAHVMRLQIVQVCPRSMQLDVLYVLPQ